MVACWAWHLNKGLKTKWQINKSKSCSVFQTNQPSTLGIHDLKRKISDKVKNFLNKLVRKPLFTRWTLTVSLEITQLDSSTLLLGGKEYERGDVFDWVIVFNREDNPCEHRCETFLICATPKLCHLYWRFLALNRTYRTVNRTTSKEICCFYVSLKTEMTMWLIWKWNRK